MLVPFLMKVNICLKQRLLKGKHKCSDDWYTVLRACVCLSSRQGVWKLKCYWNKKFAQKGCIPTWVTGNELIIQLLVWSTSWKLGISGNNSTHQREDLASPTREPRQWRHAISSLIFSLIHVPPLGSCDKCLHFFPTTPLEVLSGT